MKVLITGINGFIGRHLAIRLIHDGFNVIGLGRSNKCNIDGISKYYSGSVTEKTILKKAIKDVDVVVHLAALTSHKEIVDKRFEALELNLSGTLNILDAINSKKTPTKFIHSSTGKVYGRIIKLPITEEHVLSPQNILGKSKLIAEKLVDFYCTTKNKFIIFRIFNIYGPNQKENFLIPTILKQLRNGNNTITLGDINAKRDYVYLDDLIEAFVIVIKSKVTQSLSIYNICSGKGISAREIVKIISKIKKMEIKIKINQKLLRSDEDNIEYGSFDKIKNEFGWYPKHTLEDGLIKLISN